MFTFVYTSIHIFIYMFYVYMYILYMYILCTAKPQCLGRVAKHQRSRSRLDREAVKILCQGAHGLRQKAGLPFATCLSRTPPPPPPQKKKKKHTHTHTTIIIITIIIIIKTITVLPNIALTRNKTFPLFLFSGGGGGFLNPKTLSNPLKPSQTLSNSLKLSQTLSNPKP